MQHCKSIKIYAFAISFSQRILLQMSMVLMLLFCCIGYSKESIAQPCSNTLSGTYTVGTGGDYSNLTNAIASYNSSCIAGNVVFTLINATYSSGETFPLIINKNTDAGPNTTLTIRPAAGANVLISGATNYGPLIRVNGNYITIDGSNNYSMSRNLSITNTSIVEPRVVLFGSISTNAVSNCAIKNCVLTNGNDDKATITISDATVLASAGYFSNITIENNVFNKSLYGIYCKGVAASLNGTNLNIVNNDLSSTGANAIKYCGIYVEGVDGGLISQNKIGNFTGTDSISDKGILLSVNVKNTNVMGNVISNINYTGGKGLGPQGIFIGTSLSNANVTIANNMISNITGDGNDYTNGTYTLENPTGILLSSALAQGGIRIYHNSIFLGGTAGFTNTLNRNGAVSSGIRLRSGCTADIRNNIIVNNLGLQSNVGLGAVGILLSTGASQCLQLDYNDYYVNPTGLGVKLIGHIFSGNVQSTSLAGWKSATLKEQNGANIFPNFTSANDLHLVNTSNTALNSLGTYISGYSFDIDNTNRHLSKPDMGCDEFVPLNTANWIGKYSNAWNYAPNWEADMIPTENADLVFSNGWPYFPQLTGLIKLKGLTLSAATDITLLTIDTLSELKLCGLLVRNNGNINASKGTVTLDGIIGQQIPAKYFKEDKLLNLVIGNSSSDGVVLQGKLDVYRSFTFSTNGVKCNTNGYLTLKSTVSETAWVGNLTNKQMMGEVTVERFIPTGIAHPKSWEFIAVPLSGTQTINQAWQDTATAANQSRYVGYGTQITSNRGGNAAGAIALGFDVYTAAGSTMKIYNSTTGIFDGIQSTNSTAIANPKGYFVFVRGDRTVVTYNAAATPTVLRAKGRLYTAAVGDLPPTTMVNESSFESIGNPYASAIDFQQINRTGGIDNTFYVWDPLLPGSRGLGGYQTISASNNFVPVPGGTINYSGLESITRIESGQAFLVHATGLGSAGLVSFNEASKLSGSRMTYRGTNTQRAHQKIQTNLYALAGANRKLADGNVLLIGNQFSNDYTGEDAEKQMNAGENMSIAAHGKRISIETKNNIEAGDTIWFHLTNLNRQSYQLQFNVEGFDTSLFTPILKDNYLHTEHPIRFADSTIINFEVDATAGSYADNRFCILFKPAAILPLQFITQRATRKNKQVLIEWNVQHQEEINHFEIERSLDGIHFQSLNMHVEKHANVSTYQVFDDAAMQALGFYRVVAISENGHRIVSNVFNVAEVSMHETAAIHGCINQQKLQLQVSNFKKGNYYLSVRNTLGQLLIAQKVEINANLQYIEIDLIQMPITQVYHISLTNIENSKVVTTSLLIK